MDIDITPEPPNLDAQHTELQLRYAILQQEYQSFLFQHETLVSKSDTQHEKINHIENENAEIKGLLEKYTGEHQQLNDAYYRVMQEHEACQKVKEQLQEMAHQWKEQIEENRELRSTCTKLRQELRKAVENQTSDKPLPRVEQVQAPAAIEATTVSDMENQTPDKPLLRVEQVQAPAATEATTVSDMENQTPDKPLSRVEQVQAPAPIEATTVADMESSDDELDTWTAGSDNRNQYEVFLVYAITGECELQGYSFDISRSSKEAVPQITDSLRQAKAAFGSDQYHAITVLGIHLIDTEPAYLFGCLEANRTIFIGRNSVLAAFVPALTAGASYSQPHHSDVTIEQAATQALKEGSTRQGKRKRRKATKELAAKRRRVAGAEAAPSTPSTKAKKRKPLGILKSKKARSSERAAAATTTSTAAEEQNLRPQHPKQRLHV
jgi:regulator of replication initiation timing